jgi:hypothetical protein
MGLHQTKKILPSKGKNSKEMTYKMGENICKQKIKIQNILKTQQQNWM